ncbi:AraC family transcriptional regulator [Chryseotalea sanaruensis]|uniref:AraC family transcriptional regulator n=1 Tax=Chryseotalea sanaruensis TaxID=2482724 RepID=A0A401U5I1_9BACT|nr:helix-turn-helix transcriptional regulator [Chryseotalea sanaruensis]GCC50090.1 AraC family transcriptional regulator [Chryseotalea sanaruensis]
MDYQTYLPSESLSDFVKCYWILDAPQEDNPDHQRIVADGCMEMIIHYGDQYKQFSDNGSSFLQPRSFVFGQLTRQLEIAATGVTGIFAVRFCPDGFIPFSTIPISAMENRAVALTELYGQEGEALEKAVVSAPTYQERITILESFLLNRLKNKNTIDVITASSVETLLSLKGQLTIDQLAIQQSTSRRQLERRFANTVGLSPKQLAKIIRLQHTLKNLEQKQFNNLASLAVENGYFDQAHFIKDFKEFTGMTPKQFYADSLKMSSLFIQGA